MSVKVSVIIAAYNAEQTLARCLESLLGQTLGDFEILVVNDGSVDTTQCILDEFSERDERIHVFFQPNSGPAAARNLALSHAAGEYLTFVDADDEVTPDCLEKLCGAAEAAGADLAVCAHVRVKGESRRVYAMPEGHISIRETALETFLLNRAAKLGHSIWGKLYRMKIIRENQLDFPPARYAEDYSFNLCYYCYCNRIETIADPLYLYYLYDSSLMANIPDDIVPQMMQTLEWYTDFVQAKGKWEAVGAFGHAVWVQKAFDLLNPAFRGGLREIGTCLGKLDEEPLLWQHVKALKGRALGRVMKAKLFLLTLRPKWLRAVLVWLCMSYLLRHSMR